MGALRGAPLVHIVYALAAVGFAIDIRLRLLRAEAPPLLWWAIAYFAWWIVTVAVMTQGQMVVTLSGILIRFLLFFMAAHAIQSFRALRVAVITVVVIAGFLSDRRHRSSVGAAWLHPVQGHQRRQLRRPPLRRASGMRRRR